MPNELNKEAVKELREKISKAKSVFFADYKGIKANQMNDLRASMKAQNTEVVVAKNTLMKIALEKENYDTTMVKDQLKEANAAFIAYSDALAPLKPLFEFVKKFEMPKVKAGFVEGTYADARQVEVLSTLPSKEQLLAQVVGGLKAPLSGFVNVMGGTQRKLVYALSAIANKKSESTQA